MSTISVTGLGSGLDYDTWIEKLVAVKQNDINKVSSKVNNLKGQESTLSDLESLYKNLLNSIETFTNPVSTKDLFNQKATTTSSSAVTATADSTAANQSFSVEITQLATSTVAKSTYNVASYIDSGTKISEVSEGAIDDGFFSIYVNGKQSKINITSGETLGDVVNSITSTLGSDVTASINSDGTLSITANNSTTSVTVGSSSDTSNFANIMALEATTTTVITTTESSTTTTSLSSYTSSNSIYDTDTSSAITSTEFSTSTGGTASVKAGNFYINNVEITVGANSSLDDVVASINKSSAGVKAYWDSTAGKLTVTSDDTGATSIDIAAGTSNFTDVMGLTSSTWNEDGSLNSTSLVDGSQDLGDNAKAKINGTTITSSTNKITSDISGLAGVTLNLNAKTTAKATVTVSTDTTSIEKALSSFVTSLNSVIAGTDGATATDGDLYGETILNSLRNNIRKLATSSIDGFSLANVGVTTGAIGTSVKANTNQLVVNSDTWDKFLTSSDGLDKLKNLLVGGGKGILNQMETTIENATDSVDGYFTTRQGSYEDQVDRLNDKVDRMTTAMNSYQKQLESKFEAMDKLISSLESSASIFDSYFNKNSKNS